MALAHSVKLEIEGCDAEWKVVRLVGRERVQGTWSFELAGGAATASGERAEIEPDTLLTRTAKVSWFISDSEERTVKGLVEAVDAVGIAFEVLVVPRLALLSDAVDHQVFTDLDSVEIARKVLGEHQISVDARVKAAPAKRAQCVQYFESDLAFVTRILAEDGLAWYAPLGEKDEMVICDGKSGFEPLPGTGELRVAEGGGLLGEASVRKVRLDHKHVHDKVTLRDFNFEKPKLEQTASAVEGAGTFELYDYPGGYGDPEAGKKLAAIRLEQERGRRIVLHGETSSRRLAPGYIVELGDSPRTEVNGRWLLLEVEHTMRDRVGPGEARYVCQFSAVPADGGYRPQRSSALKLAGVQTATVTGPKGGEIHTEAHSRVKVQLRWDRRRPKDDTSSAWVRVVHPPTSGGFMLPRVGWEALLSFSGTSADGPIVLGRLYNGAVTPPNALPANKVVSAFGSLTTPGGGSANLIEMNDTAGNEGMTFNASKDFNERTENDKATSITANDSHTVGANRTVIVGNVHNLGVDGAQSYTVGASRSVAVEANKSIVAASETVVIGGMRLFNVGGDYQTGCASLVRLIGGSRAEAAIEHVTRSVQGISTVLVGGGWKVAAGPSAGCNVLGASTEVVAGAKSIKSPSFTLAVRGALSETYASRTVKAGGDRAEKFGAAGSYSIGGSATIKGSDVVIVATSKLTIKASGITIEITPSSVTVDGKFKGSVEALDKGAETYE